MFNIMFICLRKRKIYWVTVGIDTTAAKYTVSGANLGKTYTSVGPHFHWAAKSCHGSEHTINGVHYPFEVSRTRITLLSWGKRYWMYPLGVCVFYGSRSITIFREQRAISYNFVTIIIIIITPLIIVIPLYRISDETSSIKVLTFISLRVFIP